MARKKKTCLPWLLIVLSWQQVTTVLAIDMKIWQIRSETSKKENIKGITLKLN